MRVALEATRHRLDDIADINRLKLRLAAVDQGQERRKHTHLREQAEEAVTRPEDDRWPDDACGWKGRADSLFPFTLALGVERFAIFIGADGRHVHEAAHAG